MGVLLEEEGEEQGGQEVGQDGQEVEQGGQEVGQDGQEVEQGGQEVEQGEQEVLHVGQEQGGQVGWDVESTMSSDKCWTYSVTEL